MPRPNFRTLLYHQEIRKAYSENIDKTLARTVNPDWGKLRNTVQLISRGFVETNPKRKPWMTNHMIALIRQREELKKVSSNPEYKKLSKEIKKQCKEVKNAHAISEILEIERLEDKNDTFSLNKRMKQLIRKQSSKSKGFNNDKGGLLTSPENITKRWKQYLDHLYRLNGEHLKPEDKYSDDNTTITMIEFKATLKKLRNKKCVGCDQVPKEALRCLNNSSLSIVHQTVKNAYETGELNVAFLTSLIIALPKKKGFLKCDEHRSIAIITHTVKILLISAAKNSTHTKRPNQ